MNDKQTVQPDALRIGLPADAQSYGITQATWKILIDVIFPTALSAASILMALDYCKARSLDIFKKPVHIVPMWSSAKNQQVETVWPSVNEIQTTAARTNSWAGMDRPLWGPDKTMTFKGRIKDGNTWKDHQETVTFPEWVAVTVYRIVHNKRCAFTEEVYWLEAYSTSGRFSSVPNAMWLKRPRGQLAKCGKAASLRAAFPEEVGYSAEEMDGKIIDIEATTVTDNVAATDVVPNPNTEPSPEAPVPDAKPVVIDASQLNPKFIKAVESLVQRTQKAGAWSAARDFAQQRFAGIELTYALAELDKATAMAALTHTEGMTIPPMSAKDAELAKARQTLNS
ncbi:MULTISPECIES: phage recombination protein Bet [Methylomonas]|uniref:Recombinase n=1 Tax=Methylomonas koyamae TaxID=702114 RepID=A0A177N6J4_9GAMM|nr:phage recombination protein Bet [Methylomonas koyamae]OAI12750.1 recombinase [Methylomonas koyamae]